MEMIKHHSVNKMIVLLAVSFAILEGTIYLEEAQIINIPPFLIRLFEIILTAVVVFLVISIIVRLTTNSVYRFFENDMEIEERIFLTQIYTFVLYATGLAIVLTRVGLSIDNITLILGLATTGIAFAVRDVLSSFLIWFILLIKKPFRLGDIIRIDEYEGIVTHISTFYVTIEDTLGGDNTTHKIPNKMFLEKAVTKHGKDIEQRIKVNLHSVPGNIRKMILSTLADLKRSKIPVNEMFLESREGDLQLVIRYQVPYAKRHDTRTAVVEKIHQDFKEYIKVK